MRKRPTRPSGRDADPRRTIPLNSATWRYLRLAVLRDEPLCRHCALIGMEVIATDVDHADGNPANNDRSNLQPLCHECHSRKTMRNDEGITGCNVDGIPVDPSHPWNR